MRATQRYADFLQDSSHLILTPFAGNGGAAGCNYSRILSGVFARDGKVTHSSASVKTLRAQPSASLLKVWGLSSRQGWKGFHDWGPETQEIEMTNIHFIQVGPWGHGWAGYKDNAAASNLQQEWEWAEQTSVFTFQLQVGEEKKHTHRKYLEITSTVR